MLPIKSKIARSLGAGLTATGVATLDEDSLGFKTSGILGPLMRGKGFRVALEDISELSWTVRSSTLRIKTGGGDEFALQGASGVRLLIVMSAMNVASGGSQESGAVGSVVADAAATLASGPVYYRGRLALGAGGFFWECTGSVEQLVGISGIRVGLDEFAGAHVQDDGITLFSTRGEEHRFLTDEPEALVQLLSELARQGADPAMDGMEDRDSEGDEGAALRFGATLHELGTMSTSRGTMVVAHDGAMIAHRLVGARLEIEAVHVQRLAYGEPDPRAVPEMLLATTSGTQLRIIPDAGWAPLNRLFKLSRSLPLLGTIAPASHPVLSRAVGAVASVACSTALVDELSIRPAVLLHLDEAIGVVLPEGMSWDVPPGTRVRLKIGMPRALLNVSGRYMKCGHRDRSEDIPGWPRTRASATVAEVAIVDEAAVERIATRRETFRVTTVDELSVREMERHPRLGLRAVGPRIVCRLFNISLGGCGLLLREEWPVGTWFELDLELSSGRLTLRLEVVFSAPINEDNERWWRHGARISGLSTADQTRVAQEVRRREVNTSLTDA